MKASTMRMGARIFAAALFALPHMAAWAQDDVMIDGQAWQEVDRKELKNGHIQVELKRKPTAPAPAASAVAAASPPAADVAKPPQDAKSAMKKANDSPTDSTLAGTAAGFIPALDKEFAEVLAKESQPTDSPGLTALGVSASDFNQPVTPKDLAAFIARGTDYTGKVKEGVAVQFAPVNLFFPRALVGGSTYENSPWMQIAARTSLELATAKSDDARIGQQLAASVTIGLIDGADPRLFWAPLDNCSRTALQQLDPPPKPSFMMSEAEKKAWNERQALAVQGAKACYAAYLKANEKLAAAWARPRWYVGYAKAWQTGESDRIQDRQPGPAMWWTSFSYGAYRTETGVRALFQLNASRKTGLQVKDPLDDSKFAREDRSDFMMRLRFSRDRWSAFGDAGVARVRTGGVLSEHVRRYGYGAEYKLSDTLWLVLGSVTERGFVSSEKRTLLNTGLRFGQSDKPLFGELGK